MRLLLIIFCLFLFASGGSLAQEPAQDTPEWITKGSRVIDDNSVTQGLYQDAVDVLQKAYMEGNLEAAHFLGRAYLEGKGVPADKQAAYALIEQAAVEGNYALAQSTMCKFHMLGQNFEKDLTLAKQYCLSSAQQGSEEGQWILARIYHLEGDKTQATYWYEQAAINGNRNAMHWAGLMYMHGDGVQKDLKKSAHYLEGAATFGDRQAQFTLGNAYYQGNVFAKNDVAAFHWYKMAAENNHTRAQLSYGMMYWGGMGVSINIPEAYKWMAVASKNESCKYSRLAKNYMGKLAPNLTHAQRAAIKEDASALSFDQAPLCE